MAIGRYSVKGVLDKRKEQSEDEKAMIEEFMKKKGLTKCPPVLAQGSELKESRQKQYSENAKQWRKENKGWKKNRVVSK